MNFKLSDAIQILSRTPMVIKELLLGLPDEWILSNEGTNTWSPFDILGHLIHGEKTDWIPRARIILGNQENKTFIPFDRFAQFEESKGKSVDELIDEFTILRKENIITLKQMNLQPEHLGQIGIHPDFGKVTLRQLLATWVVHDLSHINQMTRVMAKNYQVEAGPWTRYISILSKGT